MQVGDPMGGQDEITGRRKRPSLFHNRHAHISLPESTGIVESIAHHQHRSSSDLLTLANEIQLLSRALPEPQFGNRSEQRTQSSNLAVVIAAEECQFSPRSEVFQQHFKARTERMCDSKDTAVFPTQRHMNLTAGRVARGFPDVHPDGHALLAQVIQ